MKKALKIIGKCLLILLVTIFVIIVGLIINNRIYYIKFSSADIDSNNLSKSEIDTAENILSWLDDNGDEIFDGFDGSIDMILFNRGYEFLFTTKEYTGWEFVSSCFEGKSIYRRKANNPQAFATKVGGGWAGSFTTYDYFNVSLLEQIPIVVPPQLLSYDDIGYRSIVVHEMLHAYQGKCDYDRVDKAEHIKNVNSGYFISEKFNNYINQEGELLEKAINTDYNSIDETVSDFLSVRDKRREELKLSEVEIANEQKLEWLEGSARYAEYIAAKGSKSSISKGLINISEKVKTQSDDRYYTLGMAQILLIKRLDIVDWQEKLFYKGYTPESLLREYISK